MQRINSSDESALEKLLARAGVDLAAAEKAVAPIVAEVRREGDRALARWSRRLDGQAPRRIGADEIAAAWRRTPAELRRALRHAARNITQMAQWQRPRGWMRTMEPGVRVGQVVHPLGSVGCYVPGGRHPLPSSLLMTAIPARVAGVPRVVVVCPQAQDAVLAAAHLAGISEMHCVGGAQAIAALAYGTANIARVDKIVGPGNSFVTAAKKLVWADCAVDFLAGPTEVLIVAGRQGNAAAIAADLIAQAEHDPQAGAWLATDSKALAAAVERAVARQLRAAPNPVAAEALARRGTIVLTRDLDAAMALANRLAPEHITVPPDRVAQTTSAGSIFAGDYAPQAVGDYISGTNHVLPTAGGARARGGLSVLDFVKVITVQQLTAAGLRRLAPDIATLARAEGLAAHAASVVARAEARQ